MSGDGEDEGEPGDREHAGDGEAPQAERGEPTDGEGLLPPSGADDDEAVPSGLGDDGDDAPAAPEDQPVDADAPLGDLAERARSGAADPADDEVMDAFEEVEVDDVEVDELWSALEGDGLDDTVDEPRTTSEREVEVVDKREYCQRCRFFSAPPEMRCTHETGEILELVDTESFRVADCPVLRGEEDL